MKNLKLNHFKKTYLPIIGLEVHIELKTKSKMFCGCSAEHFLVKPNTHTCPVCLGLPGALPVPNQRAIDYCLMIGLALNCQINDYSKFDRKNYFYPDLPKGYQISQYDQPFCKNGKIGKVRINRVHLEEDTAKLIHHFESKELKNQNNNSKLTLIDFNRSGVPLVEIVSEPDINSSEEAINYLKKIQQIVRYLNVSDCDMEKGSMRCEANVSLKKIKIQNLKLKNTKQNLKLPDYKVEIKNINSFRFVGRAIEYEIKRQISLLESGKNPLQETRGFDPKTGETYSQRFKEEAHDYRYFPEPDIPPFINLKVYSAKLKAKLPELPDSKIARFIKQYAISKYNAEILCANRKTADYFEECIKVLKQIKNKTINQLNNQFVASLIVNKKIATNKYLPAEFIKILLKKTTKANISENDLDKIIKKVLKDNPKPVSDYKKGKTNAIMFLIGLIMREIKGGVDAKHIKEKIELLIANS